MYFSCHPRSQYYEDPAPLSLCSLLLRVCRYLGRRTDLKATLCDSTLARACVCVCESAFDPRLCIGDCSASCRHYPLSVPQMAPQFQSLDPLTRFYLYFYSTYCMCVRRDTQITCCNSSLRQLWSIKWIHAIKKGPNIITHVWAFTCTQDDGQCSSHRRPCWQFHSTSHTRTPPLNPANPHTIHT